MEEDYTTEEELYHLIEEWNCYIGQTENETEIEKYEKEYLDEIPDIIDVDIQSVW